MSEVNTQEGNKEQATASQTQHESTEHGHHALRPTAPPTPLRPELVNDLLQTHGRIEEIRHEILAGYDEAIANAQKMGIPESRKWKLKWPWNKNK